MLLLWAGCSLGSTAPSSCATETSTEVSSSCLEEATVKHTLKKWSKAEVKCCSSCASSLVGPQEAFPHGPGPGLRGGVWRTGAEQLVGQDPYTNKSGGERRENDSEKSMWVWMQKDLVLVIYIKPDHGCKLLIPFIPCSQCIYPVLVM